MTKINIEECKKDFDILLNKYKIKKAVFIAEHNIEEKYQLFTKTSSKSEDIQKSYMKSLHNMIQYTGLDQSNFDAVADILEQNKLHNLYYKNVTTLMKIRIAEKKLSITDLVLLEQYRKIKIQYVKDTNYEMAAVYRKIELQLLNLKL